MKALCEEAGMGVVLSKAESLEPRRSRRTYPGPSHRWSEAPSTLSKLKDSIRQVVGWPTATSIDTVTIARKPTEAEGRVGTSLKTIECSSGSENRSET